MQSVRYVCLSVYYGHHSSKQFIHGKPIRFGFQIWCLNARLGYLIQFEPYQGASASYDSSLGNNIGYINNITKVRADGLL